MMSGLFLAMSLSLPGFCGTQEILTVVEVAMTV
jgi:hypothetical protein